MSWRLRYHLDWPELHESRITRAAQELIAELGGKLQVEPGDDMDGRTFEAFFTVPLARLQAREDADFDALREQSDLSSVTALTVTAVFYERPPELMRPGIVRCVFTVSGEEGSNDLCRRTARFVAEHLAESLEAWPAGEGHTKRRLAPPG